MVKVTVIGSSSMDLVVTSGIRPGVGETVLGDSFKTVPGGKGANQAVAASRLGADVTMIGCVGEDQYGEVIISNLIQNGVCTDYVKAVTGVESGTAHIILAEQDNSIIVIKGANDYVTPTYVQQALKVIIDSDIVIVQQEIPEETVEYVCEVCEVNGVPLLLNPAPARSLKKEVVEKATYLTPNEHEVAILFMGASQSEMLQQYPNKLFITEGEKGVRYFNGKEEVLVATFPVQVIDTTGAGDTFNAAFAVALAEGKEYTQALKFANRAASLSVTKFGAQGGMPTRQEVEACLNK
ncbi:ribokinase [Bacillus massiliigorillae]|uniref:ribokinase n=1 Tax=Bacillus massiliigorillae TaxID=1243664 RepID=UPI0003AA1C8D|nr:ribokinase [Bacillus massiliigorillae]